MAWGMRFDDALLAAKANNFTLVRLVLASSVIYTHCYWLVHRVEGRDELSFLLGAPISTYAVDGFFFLSGFLVYPSLLRLKNPGAFLLARLTRLWPALALSVTLTVLGGLAFTAVALPDYFGGQTARFIAGNLSLATAQFYLTGVTCSIEPCPVNGSLWTLPWEARCYILLALLGLTGLASPRYMTRLILPATLAGALIAHVPAFRELALSIRGDGLLYLIDLVDRLWFLFAAGIAAYIFRQRIVLSWAILVLLFVANVIAHRIGMGIHVRALFVGYAVLCFGLLSARNGAVSGRWPDYSYGMYIYAFPIMMAFAAIWPPQSHWPLILSSAAATALLAAFSWHVVEKPALDAFRRRRGRSGRIAAAAPPAA